MTVPCGCKLEGKVLVEACDYHLEHDKKVVNRTALYLEAKIKRAFGETFLYEIRDKVIAEVRKLRK